MRPLSPAWETSLCLCPRTFPRPLPNDLFYGGTLLRYPRLLVLALALVVVLALSNRAALAAPAVEASSTLPPGQSASFNVSGFSLFASRPFPASVQVSANVTAAQAQTWRNIVYYAADWGLLTSDPQQVQAALWYVSDGTWSVAAHADAQRLVDTARSGVTPATQAQGYDLTAAIMGGRASATASFSDRSGTVTVNNLQATALTVYIPYGLILSGPDGSPAYIVYANSSGNSNPPPSQPTPAAPTQSAPASPTTALPTAQPTSGATQPLDTATPAAKPTATTNPPLPPANPTAQPSSPASRPPAPAAGANQPATQRITPPPADTPAPPPTASPAPTNTQAATTFIGQPTAEPTQPVPTPPGPAQPAQSKANTTVADVQAAAPPLAPTPIPTDDTNIPTPMDTGGILPTPQQTIYPTFTPQRTPNAKETPVPSATSVFPPTATAKPANPPISPPNFPTVPPPPSVGTGTAAPPASSQPTATLPTLSNGSDGNTPPLVDPNVPGYTPPGSGTGNGSNTSGVSGPATTAPPTAVNPATGEQSSLPLILLIAGGIVVVAGVVFLILSNRSKSGS